MKTTFYIYLTALLLATLLPLNAQDSALNNNHTLNIRWDYLLHALVYLPLPALLFAIISQKFALIRKITNSRSRQFAKNSRLNERIHSFGQAHKLEINDNSNDQKFAIPIAIGTPARNHASSRKFHANSDARKNSLTVLLISLSIGIGLELLQLLVPYRSFNINDLIANVVGVLLGWIIITVFGTHLMEISKTKHK